MRANTKYFVLLIVSYLSIINLFAQRESAFSIEASGVFGTEQTPFWMRANKYGMVPVNAQIGIFSIGTSSDYSKSGKKIKWGYGLNIGAFVGVENKVLIQQGYIKGKWRAFEIYAGRKKEIQGLIDSTLSSGSYIWSGNALPMPKVQFSIPEFASIGGEGLISIKGNYAHGWFDRHRADALGIFLHQKSAYMRIGKPNYKLKFYTGFIHQAQWGGKILFPDPDGTYSENGRFGSSFRDYLYIITGRSSVGEDTAKFSGKNEILNRVGNHLGTMDVAFEILMPKVKLFLYRQSIFEDGSLYYLNNITDGLNGISLTFKNEISKKNNIKKITFEFLNTLNQGGDFNGDNPLAPSTRGRDDYFNNSQFRDGWSYNKTSIGTPFLLTKYEFPKSANKPYDLIFTNNRVQAYYVGITGKILNDYNFESRFSFSKNWGRIDQPLSELFQNSFYLNINKQIPQIIGGINGFITAAGDFGDLLNQNIAIQIGFKKTWNSSPILSHPTHKYNPIH